MEDFLTSRFTDEQLMMGSFYAFLFVVAISILVVCYVELKIYNKKNDLKESE